MKNHIDNIANTENVLDLPSDKDFCFDAQNVNGKRVEYKTLFGNENIVFIKAGAEGNIRSRNNKYLKMARRVNKWLGATVICASNPDVLHEEVDEAKIKRVIAEKGFTSFKLSFIGTSDGAYHNLSLAKRFPETVKWLGINTSYINVPALKERLLSLHDIYKILIYGTNDDDFNEVVPAVSSLANDNLVLKTVDNADHSFTGMIDEFIALADCLCK